MWAGRSRHGAARCCRGPCWGKPCAALGGFRVRSGSGATGAFAARGTLGGFGAEAGQLARRRPAERSKTLDRVGAANQRRGRRCDSCGRTPAGKRPYPTIELWQLHCRRSLWHWVRCSRCHLPTVRSVLTPARCRLSTARPLADDAAMADDSNGDALPTVGVAAGDARGKEPTADGAATAGDFSGVDLPRRCGRGRRLRR